MKTRIIVLLAITAVATLSFTFKETTKENKPAAKQSTQQKQAVEPLGGFVSEDKF
jgi:flagellar basal body-associated protein FliL